MLIDHTALRAQTRTYDVAVVGSGPAGLSVATRLVGSGLSILLIEAGSARETPASRSDYRGKVVPGNGHPALDLYRKRALGGTSSIWGGRAIPFDRIDFERRPWVAGSGWPIRYDEIANYYPLASNMCEAGSGEADPHEVVAGRPTELVEGLDGREIQTTFERFSRPTDFWKRFGPALLADDDIHVLTNACAVRVGLSPSANWVTSIDLQLDGERIPIAARAYVIAGGGLEVPRLLLASDDICTTGAGNASGLVGRYYMGHFCATFGRMTIAAHRSVAHAYERDAAGIYVRRRLWTTEAAQRSHALLNTTFRTHLPEVADPQHGDAVLSAMFLAKAFVQREYAARFAEQPVPLSWHAGHVANIVTGAVPLARFARGWTRDRILATRKLPSVVRGPFRGGYTLEFHAEQSPCFASRVQLVGECDRHGLRRLELDWHCHRSDIEALERAYRILAARLEATRTGHLDADYSQLETRMTAHGLSTGHHLGTTRMSEDPRNGVVDADCRVHGIGNLYIASSSVFPTSGQANPTLTIVALALRLGDKLRDVLRHGESLVIAKANSERQLTAVDH